MGLFALLGWDPGGFLCCCLGMLGDVTSRIVVWGWTHSLKATLHVIICGSGIRDRGWLRRRRRLRMLVHGSAKARRGLWGPGPRSGRSTGPRDVEQQLKAWLRGGGRAAWAAEWIGGCRRPMRWLWRKRMRRSGVRCCAWLLRRHGGAGVLLLHKPGGSRFCVRPKERLNKGDGTREPEEDMKSRLGQMRVGLPGGLGCGPGEVEASKGGHVSPEGLSAQLVNATATASHGSGVVKDCKRASDEHEAADDDLRGRGYACCIGFRASPRCSSRWSWQ